MACEVQMLSGISTAAPTDQDRKKKTESSCFAAELFERNEEDDWEFKGTLFDNEDDRKPPEGQTQDKTTSTASRAVTTSVGRLVLFRFGKIEVYLPPPVEETSADVSLCIWRGSMLLSAYLCALPVTASGLCSSLPPINCAGKDVLELGCGRGLAGLTASALQARRVVLTDCDDRALACVVQSPSVTSAKGAVEVKHFLWECDQRVLEIEQEQRALGPGSSVRLEEEVAEKELPRVRHWCDVYRQPRQFAALPRNDEFDVVIASECLYFAAQEEPLLAALMRRVRKPDGIAIIQYQLRGNTAFCIERLGVGLEREGFHVQSDIGPFDYATMLRQHVHCVKGQTDLRLTRSQNEATDGGTRLLLASRKPLNCASSGSTM